MLKKQLDKTWVITYKAFSYVKFGQVLIGKTSGV